MSKWIRFNKFIDDITETKDPKDIHKLTHSYFAVKKCKTIEGCFHSAILDIWKVKTNVANGINALKKLYPIYANLFPKLTSRRRYLSQVRQVIKKHQDMYLYGESLMDRTFNLNKEERAKLAQDYNNQVKLKNENKIQINVRDIESKIFDLVKSVNVYDKVILILLCIGSRPKGVLHLNTFRLLDDGRIEISNMAKKRGQDKKQKVARPVLFITGSDLVKKWNEVRNHFKRKRVKMTNKYNELAKDKQNTLNKRVVYHFPFVKKFRHKSSILRKIYADLSYKQFADKSTMNFNSWVSKTLGHNDLLTSFSYSYLNVRDLNKVEGVEEITQRLRTLELKYKLLLDKTSNQEKTQANTKLTKDQKIAKMKELYDKNPNITNAEMRKQAGIGSRLVNEWIRIFRERSKKKY